MKLLVVSIILECLCITIIIQAEEVRKGEDLYLEINQEDDEGDDDDDDEDDGDDDPDIRYPIKNVMADKVIPQPEIQSDGELSVRQTLKDEDGSGSGSGSESLQISKDALMTLKIKNMEQNMQLMAKKMAGQVSLQVGILVDVSSSIGKKGNLKKIKSFLKILIKRLLSQKGISVGLVTHQSKPKIVLNVISGEEKRNISSIIENNVRTSKYHASISRTLRIIDSDLFGKTHVSEHRSFKQTILIMVLAGGEPFTKTVKQAVSSIGAHGIKVFCVGVGSYYKYNTTLLQTMSSFPSGSHIITTDFDNLPKVAEDLNLMLKRAYHPQLDNQFG